MVLVTFLFQLVVWILAVLANGSGRAAIRRSAGKIRSILEADGVFPPELVRADRREA